MKNLKLSFAISRPTNLIDYVVIQYIQIFLLILNGFLLLFTLVNLSKLSFKKTTSRNEKKEAQFRIYVYTLILLAITFREISESFHLHDLSSNGKPSHFNSLLIIIDALPILLFINLATTFSYFWFRTYSSFDNSQQELRTKKKNFKYSILVFTILLYTGFIILSAVCAINKNLNASRLLKVLLMFGLIWSAVFMIVHGSILYNKTIELVQYTRERLRSTGVFKTIYLLLLACCIIKCIEEGLALYFSGNDEVSLSQDSNFVFVNNYLAFFIVYTTVFVLIGECLPFFLFVLLLEKNAKKWKESTSSSNEHFVEDSHDSEVVY